MIQAQRPMIKQNFREQSVEFDGTEASFERLFKLLYAPLIRYAGMQGVRDEAEDVVQQVFLKFWDQKESLNVGHVKGYLYKSVYHECVNRSRHAKVKERYMEHNLREMNSSAAQAHQATEGRELEKKISLALSELPEQCGNVFKLSRFHSLTYAQIAEVMGISVKTVENHMGKALSIMRNKLAEYLVVFIIFLSFIFKQ